ncbi:hypothetical protein RJ55_06755 [Drechmeria coniospora]|nr:hypothetical protein RJ55_06755 [Drechmeria coniospora]
MTRDCFAKQAIVRSYCAGCMAMTNTTGPMGAGSTPFCRTLRHAVRKEYFGLHCSFCKKYLDRERLPPPLQFPLSATSVDPSTTRILAGNLLLVKFELILRSEILHN